MMHVCNKKRTGNNIYSLILIFCLLVLFILIAVFSYKGKYHIESRNNKSKEQETIKHEVKENIKIINIKSDEPIDYINSNTEHTTLDKIVSNEQTIKEITKPTEIIEQKTPKIDTSLFDPEGNIILKISNQSFAIDPVDIQVFVDDKLVVSQNFQVRDQHSFTSFRIKLDVGLHTFRASSEKGEAEIVVPFNVKDIHWGIITYWYYPPDHYNPTPKHFCFSFQNEPLIIH